MGEVNLLRYRVKNLYKTLTHLGREYPLGFDYFRPRCHRAFIKNKDESDPEKIEMLIKHGEYIVKELEALYMLKKYRTLKRRYYNDDLTKASYEAKLKVIDEEGSK